MIELLLIGLVFTAASQSSPKAFASPRLQSALECDVQCKHELHTCIDDVAEECMRSCARGLAAESLTPSVTVGDWFDCYHSCISSAGIRCFVQGGNCLVSCKNSSVEPQPRIDTDDPLPQQSSSQSSVPIQEPSFMRRHTFNPDFSNYELYSSMSASFPDSVGSAQLYHNLKVEVQRRTKNYLTGSPLPLSHDF